MVVEAAVVRRPNVYPLSPHLFRDFVSSVFIVFFNCKLLINVRVFISEWKEFDLEFYFVLLNVCIYLLCNFKTFCNLLDCLYFILRWKSRGWSKMVMKGLTGSTAADGLVQWFCTCYYVFILHLCAAFAE